MKKGFTLVELSIVLVIIGLLIGGILMAQSLIESAKVSRFATQIQQYDAAINSFTSRYRCLPGDNDIAGLGGASYWPCDGRIMDAAQNDNRFDGEIAKFWKDLVLTGFNSHGLTGERVSNSFVLGVTMPKAAIGNDCGVLAASAQSFEEISSIIDGPFYSVHRFSFATPFLLNVTGAPCLDGVTALSVDVKLDDGKANSGDIIGGFAILDLSSYRALGDNSCYSQVDGSYFVDSSSEGACGLHIKINRNQ